MNRNGKETRDKALEAGLAILRDRGLHFVTHRTVAAAIGITHPALIYHFASVAVLRQAIAEHAVFRQDGKAIGRLIADKNPAVAKLPGKDVDRYLRCLAG